MKHLLVLKPFREEHLERLYEAAGDKWTVEVHRNGLEGNELRQALRRADAVIGTPPLSMLHECPNVQWVQSTFAGTDEYTRAKRPFPEGMILTNAVGAFGNIMSQYVIGQILSIMQNLPAYQRQQKLEKWEDLGAVASLEGAEVLIFGTGGIGSATARRLQGFDAHIVGVCRDTSKPRAYFDRLVTLDEAEDELSRADVVVCCVPNTAETEHYLNAHRLYLLKRGAVLVNVGRGNFLDTLALADLLAQGHLRGVALDVTEPEPLPAGHPLWREPRCVITPHVSGGSFSRHYITEDNICNICCENLHRWNAGEELHNRVL